MDDERFDIKHYCGLAFSHVDLRPEDILIAKNYLATKDSLPQKKNDEDYTAYYNRLKELWGKDKQVKETHERWKTKHRNGVLERDFKQRAFIQLRELLLSGFLRNDFIETGMPPQDCEQAKQKLTEKGWEELLKVEGADWKFALLCRHLLVKTEQRLLCDKDNVGYYINDMRKRLKWDGVEAFFRFDTYMQLVYDDLAALEDDEAFEDVDDEVNNELEEGECPQVFDKRLNVPKIIAKLKDLNSDNVQGKRRWYVFYRVFKFLEWTKVTQQDFIEWVAFHFEWDKKREFRGVPPEFTHNEPPNWGKLVIKGKNGTPDNEELGPAYYAFAVEIRDAFVLVGDSGEMHDKEEFLVGPRKVRIAHHNTWI